MGSLCSGATDASTRNPCAETDFVGGKEGLPRIGLPQDQKGGPGLQVTAIPWSVSHRRPGSGRASVVGCAGARHRTDGLLHRVPVDEAHWEHDIPLGDLLSQSEPVEHGDRLLRHVAQWLFNGGERRIQQGRDPLVLTPD